MTHWIVTHIKWTVLNYVIFKRQAKTDCVRYLMLSWDIPKSFITKLYWEKGGQILPVINTTARSILYLSWKRASVTAENVCACTILTFKMWQAFSREQHNCILYSWDERQIQIMHVNLKCLRVVSRLSWVEVGWGF